MTAATPEWAGSGYPAGPAAATPGQAGPDAAFTAWAEARGIDPLGMDYAEYGADGLRDAFAAGMAARPQPPATGVTPGQAGAEYKKHLDQVFAAPHAEVERLRAELAGVQAEDAGPGCLAPHCPPPGMHDCDWPKCSARLETEDV